MKTTLILFISVALLGAGCSTNQNLTNNTTNNPPTNSITNQAAEQPASGASLDLSGKGLTSIPAYVFSMSNLEYLDLSNNKLTGAPQSQIGQLKNLKSLNLSENQLTGLPAELGQLKKLETLNVSHNRLTGLPNELGNLTQLKTFDVSGNSYSTQDLDGIAAKLTNTQIKR